MSGNSVITDALDNHPLTNTEIGDLLYAAARELNVAMILAREAGIEVTMVASDHGPGRTGPYGEPLFIDMKYWGFCSAVYVTGSIHTTESAW